MDEPITLDEFLLQHAGESIAQDIEQDRVHREILSRWGLEPEP